MLLPQGLFETVDVVGEAVVLNGEDFEVVPQFLELLFLVISLLLRGLVWKEDSLVLALCVVLVGQSDDILELRDDLCFLVNLTLQPINQLLLALVDLA